MLISNLMPVLIDMIDAGISTIVESEPGRGKSTLGRDMVDYLTKRDGFKWGTQTLFMATQSPTEITGYQFKGERWWDDDGNLVKPGTKAVTPTAVTDPSLPAWMLSDEGKPLWAYRRGILRVEEWGQGEGDSKRSAAQLLLMGELGQHRLPGFKTGDGWGIVGFTNASTHRSGVTKEYDFIINRVAWIKLTDDHAGTVVALVRRGCLPHIVLFVEKHPEIVLTKGVPEEQGAWCTPRTTEMVSDFLKVRMRNNEGVIPTDDITQEACAAMVGVPAARTMFNFVRLEQEVPTIADIERNPMTAKLPNSLDARYLICYKLAYDVTEKNAAKVLKYIDRLGKEFAVTFAKAACGRMPLLVINSDFVEWTKGNSSLMSLMAMFQ